MIFAHQEVNAIAGALRNSKRRQLKSARSFVLSEVAEDLISGMASGLTGQIRQDFIAGIQRHNHLCRQQLMNTACACSGIGIAGKSSESISSVFGCIVRHYFSRPEGIRVRAGRP